MAAIAAAAAVTRGNGEAKRTRMSSEILGQSSGSDLRTDLEDELRAVKSRSSGRVRYVFIEYLGGRKNKSAVYSARDAHTGGMVAIKCVATSDPTLRRRFKRELEILQLVAHPKVVGCKLSTPFESRDQSLMFAVLEYVSGSNINDALLLQREEGGTLSEARVIHIAADVLEGLVHVHSKRVIHKDIKGLNILQRSTGYAIADFGISAMEEAARQHVGNSMMTCLATQLAPSGTPHYMSPEQWDSTKAVDVRTDVWSLGVLMYRCLTGKHPFGEGEEDALIIYKALLMKPLARPASVSDQLWAILAKALQKERDQRYATAQMMLNDLIPLLQIKPLPPGCDWHFFVCKHESRGAKAAMNLCHELRSRGYKVWLSNDVEAPNLRRMQDGIRKSAVVLVYLTRGIFTRPWCRDVEIFEAVRCRKSFVFVRCKKGEYAYADRRKEISARTPADFFGLGADSRVIPEFEPVAQRLTKGLEQIDWSLNVTIRSALIDRMERDYEQREANAKQLHDGWACGVVERWEDATRIAREETTDTGRQALLLRSASTPTSIIGPSPTPEKGRSASEPTTVNIVPSTPGGFVDPILTPTPRNTAKDDDDNDGGDDDDDDDNGASSNATAQRRTVVEETLSMIRTRIKEQQTIKRERNKKLRMADRRSLKLHKKAIADAERRICAFRKMEAAQKLVLKKLDDIDTEASARRELRELEDEVYKERIREGQKDFEAQQTDKETEESLTPSGDAAVLSPLAPSPSSRRFDDDDDDDDDDDAITSSEGVMLTGGTSNQRRGDQEIQGSVVVTKGEAKWSEQPEGQVFAAIRTLEGHASPVNSVTISPNGMHIASASDDKTIRVWDAKTGRCVQMLEGHEKHVRSVIFSPNSQQIVSGSADTSVRIWSATTGLCQLSLTGHTINVTSVAISLDGRRIASGSFDKTVRMWDATTGACLLGGPLKGHTSVVESVAISPNGQQIVSGSWDSTLRVWCTNTGACLLGPISGHTTYVTSVKFAPNGKQIMSGSRDKTLRVWDARTGCCVLGPLAGHTGKVFSVTVSESGQQIISGSADKTVRVWDAKTGECLQGPFEGHSGDIFSVAFAPDATWFASGSRDKTVKIWSLDRPRDASIPRDAISDAQKEFARSSKRKLVMLKEITDSQLSILRQLDEGFARLKGKVHDCIQAIYAAAHLCINRQRSDIPILFLLVPSEGVDSFVSVCADLKRNHVGAKPRMQAMDLYICDESPLLLSGGRIKRAGKPCHDGIKIDLPGHLLVRLSPLFYIFSKLLLLLAGTAKIPTEIPFPSKIPGIGNILKETEKLKQIAEAFERLAGLSNKLEEAKNMVEALKEHTNVEVNGGHHQHECESETLGNLQLAMTASYTALKELLTEKLSAAHTWRQFKDAGPMRNVYSVKDGGLRWVTKKHASKLCESGLYRLRQLDESSRGSESKSSTTQFPHSGSFTQRQLGPHLGRWKTRFWRGNYWTCCESMARNGDKCPMNNIIVWSCCGSSDQHDARCQIAEDKAREAEERIRRQEEERERERTERILKDQAVARRLHEEEERSRREAVERSRLEAAAERRRRELRALAEHQAVARRVHEEEERSRREAVERSRREAAVERRHHKQQRQQQQEEQQRLQQRHVQEEAEAMRTRIRLAQSRVGHHGLVTVSRSTWSAYVRAAREDNALCIIVCFFSLNGWCFHCRPSSPTRLKVDQLVRHHSSSKLVRFARVDVPRTFSTFLGSVTAVPTFGMYALDGELKLRGDIREVESALDDLLASHRRRIGAATSAALRPRPSSSGCEFFLACRNGHKLQENTERTKRRGGGSAASSCIICDNCRRRQMRGSTVFSCSTCDVDLCSSCHASGTRDQDSRCNHQ